MRFAYSSVDELKEVTEITDEEIGNSDFGTNTTESGTVMRFTTFVVKMNF